MKESTQVILVFCFFVSILGVLFFIMFKYEKSDRHMNATYDVWFEGENAHELAAQSEKLEYSPDGIEYLLKVGEEMELQDAIKHQIFISNQDGFFTFYSIEYKNNNNERADYEFSEFEHVKVVYKSDITKPILKRIKNDVYENKNRTTVKIPKYINFIIYMPENSTTSKNQSHYKTCTGNRGNNNYRCTDNTVESESLLNQ